MTDLETYQAQQDYHRYEAIMHAQEVSREDYLFCIKYDPQSKDNWFRNGSRGSYAYSSRGETYLNMGIITANQAAHDERQLQMEIG